MAESNSLILHEEPKGTQVSGPGPTVRGFDVWPVVALLILSEMDVESHQACTT